MESLVFVAFLSVAGATGAAAVVPGCVCWPVPLVATAGDCADHYPISKPCCLSTAVAAQS